MAGHAILTGTVHSDPHYIQGGTEKKPTHSAVVEVRVERYDYLQRQKVADRYKVQVAGAAARRLKEENTLAMGDEVAVWAELQPHGKGMNFFAKRIARLPEEGLDVMFCAGAVEKGTHSQFDKQDGSEGHVVNARLRVPTKKYGADNEYTSKNINIAIWDKKASSFGAHMLPEEEEDERRWAFVAGSSRNERQETEDGEVRYNFKTTADVIEYLKSKSQPHKHEGGVAVEGESTGDVDEENLKKMADAQDFDQDDIPF